MKQLLVAAMLVFLASCEATNSTSESAATAASTQEAIEPSTPPPAPAATTVRGKLVDEDNGEPIAATVNLLPADINDDGSFRLTTAMLDNHLSVEAAAEGFLFEDVKPGTYLVTINLPGTGMPRNLTDDQGDLMTLKVEAGQDLDLGAVKVGTR